MLNHQYDVISMSTRGGVSGGAEEKSFRSDLSGYMIEKISQSRHAPIPSSLLRNDITAN